jgi:endonuclease/exonuclease/phosphatase family metal-dependent hydrolase
VLALNTHLDDQGEVSRVESAKIIVETVRQYLDSQELGSDDSQRLNVFLTGDMNSEDHGPAYRVLESAASPVVDVLHLVPEDQHHGHYNTGTGFGGNDDRGARIDYVFLGKHGIGWKGKAVMYGVLGNRERGVYLSDHRAVVADVVLGGSCQC